MMTRGVLAVGLLAFLGGCDLGGTTQGEQAGRADGELQLRPLLPDGAKLVGATFGPDGTRYVLDQNSGLYEVSDSSAKLVLNTTGVGGIALTDVVALDADRFALTAENDGFLFQRSTGSFTSYFCYLPAPPAPPQAGGAPSDPSATPAPVSVSQTLQLQGIAVVQRTDSVAFDRDTRQLFAQPRTTRLDTGELAGSELFWFGEAGGQPTRVVALPSNLGVAGGMVAAGGNRLLVGAGSRIYEVGTDGALTLLRDLGGSVDISGMARAPNGEIWVLDGAAMTFSKIAGSL